VATAPACSYGDETKAAHPVYLGIGDIFGSSANAATATTKFNSVVAVCESDRTLAISRMLDLVQFTIDKYKAHEISPESAETREKIVRLWDRLFAFVDYPEPGLPEIVLTSAGAAGVITQDTPEPYRELKADLAADSIPVQDSNGDQRPHLFVIYPIASDCLAGTNLQQSGPCFEFAAFPTANPGWSPFVKVGVCQPVNSGDTIPLADPALGHYTDGTTKITQPIGVPYPTFCPDPDQIVQGSWNDGIGGAAKRLAWLAKRAITPNTLYAVHGGLGGLGGGFSPYSGVALQVFGVDFGSVPLGNLQAGTANTGSWTIQLTRSSTARVEKQLGNYKDTLLVLNQGGGNCATCGGLLVRANFNAEDGNYATDGIYDLEWISLQDKPEVSGDAPFVIRDHLNHEIARVTYKANKGSKKREGNLTYNGITTPIGKWYVDQPQHFKVRVNLYTKKTTIWIDNMTTPLLSNIDFVSGAVVDLASIAAEFVGHDNGVLGWAEINIHRLPDETP
jgi:hypothetical protein